MIKETNTRTSRRIKRRKSFLHTSGYYESLEAVEKGEKRKELRNAKIETGAAGITLAADILVTLGLVVAATDYKIPPEAAMCAITQGLITIPGLSAAYGHAKQNLDNLKR